MPTFINERLLMNVTFVQMYCSACRSDTIFQWRERPAAGDHLPPHTMNSGRSTTFCVYLLGTSGDVRY